MIPLTEKIIRLKEVPNLVGPGRGDKKLHISTILRWIIDGVRGLDGERVYLDAVRVGGAWKTSVEAVERFLSRLTPERGADRPKPRTPGQRRRASERAARQLEQMGV